MQIYTFQPFGYEGSIVSVETDLRRGIPAVDIVGLADGAVKESRERMRSAIRNSGYEFPPERVLISLSPADLKKEGAQFDLPIALDVINAYNKSDYDKKDITKPVIDKQVLVLGELDLSGSVRPVKGVYAAAKSALAFGVTHIICPEKNAKELENIPGLKVASVNNLSDAVYAIQNPEMFKTIEPQKKVSNEVQFDESIKKEDVSVPENIYKTLRAIEVAIAGKHNLLITGAPGCGKTMAIQNLVPYLTPLLTDEESNSVNRIYSLAGLSNLSNVFNKKAPFRMPHQTASIEGICGGGITCRPGEISLAHNGVLFLDEAAEFKSSVLQMLRVPLESQTITLSRAGRSTIYPANFQLMMAANPCPCGNCGSHDKTCLCSAKTIDMYWKKFSDPLMDRVAIKDSVEKNEKDKRKFDLDKSRERIKKAYEIQRKRNRYNDELLPEQTDINNSIFSEKCKDFYNSKIEEDFSSRAKANIRKVSITIANMEGRENVLLKDLKEAYNMCLPVLEKDRSLSLEKKKEKEIEFTR